MSADDAPQEYLCECGCGSWVALTTGEFTERIATRRPVTAQGHLIGQAHAARQLSRVLRDDAAALRAEAQQKRRKSSELTQTDPKPPVT